MRTTTLAIGFLAIWTMSAAAYTQQGASACLSDAFRLCSSAIPDAQRVGACLHAKRQQLSSACAQAFTRYTQTSGHPRHHRAAVSED
jgi:hypothetical protein